MPELNFQQKATQEGTIAYGNKFIRDDFLISSSCIETWNLYQKPQTECNFKVGITSSVDQKALISVWPENENLFTQANLLNNEEDQVQELIFQIRKSLSITYQDSLANRLLSLFKDAKDEDPDSLGIAAGSLRNFSNFLILNTNLKRPSISLTPDYNIYSSWRGKLNRVFSVHFLTNGDVRFVIFKPNDKHPERQIRLSGIATSDILMETVIPDGVSDWILK